MSHATLVLIRHGQSEWNKANLFTGWKDVPLTPAGVEEAKAAGNALKAAGQTFDIAFTSGLQRAQHTLAYVLAGVGQSDLETVKHVALNERDYGELVGKNKDEARAEFGDEQVHIWRRSYDVPPPGGESLKMTAERVLPYYQSTIIPRLQAGESVIVAAHGNSLRALVMELEGLSREEVLQLNLATGEPTIYALNERLAIEAKSVLHKAAPGPADH
ncbi:MAG: 2,3-bisphosphoglycerate-dependent phosphoglycerate mutase [Pseudomonadota bacterium]